MVVRAMAGMLGAALVLASAVGAQVAPPAPVQPGPGTVPSVVTTGHGEARVVPDRAVITVGVEVKAATAKAAGEGNARRQRAVIDTLRAMGIPAERIKTVDYTVYPERTYDREGRVSRITGYVARNAVRVEVHRIADVGVLIDATLAKGANAVNSLAFESSQADSVRRQALTDAVRQARADADAIATAAGRCILDVIELSTSEMVRPMMAMAMAERAVADAPTPIEPGEQTVSVTVTGRWQLQSAGRVCPN